MMMMIIIISKTQRFECRLYLTLQALDVAVMWAP